jgi:hypothetical protein
VAAAATYSPPASSVATEADALGMNSRSIVLIALLFVLLMYVAHCTYVTSNAYSHPSVVLQSHTSDGYQLISAIGNTQIINLIQRTHYNGRLPRGLLLAETEHR